MESIHYLTIGYIPSDCESERIICGDPEVSGTKEVSLKIEGNKMTSIDTDQTIEVEPSEFLNVKVSYGNKW